MFVLVYMLCIYKPPFAGVWQFDWFTGLGF